MYSRLCVFVGIICVVVCGIRAVLVEDDEVVSVFLVGDCVLCFVDENKQTNKQTSKQLSYCLDCFGLFECFWIV